MVYGRCVCDSSHLVVGKLGFLELFRLPVWRLIFVVFQLFGFVMDYSTWFFTTFTTKSLRRSAIPAIFQIPVSWPREVFLNEEDLESLIIKAVSPPCHTWIWSLYKVVNLRNLYGNPSLKENVAVVLDIVYSIQSNAVFVNVEYQEACVILNWFASKSINCLQCICRIPHSFREMPQKNIRASKRK